MSKQIEDTKAAIRAFLKQNCRPVPPKTWTSQLRHLEVWETLCGHRAIGLEFEHGDIVNIWVTSLNIPAALPNSVKVARKTPKGSKWTDVNGDGASSNLSAYDAFRTKPIARLGVVTADDAEAILAHLTR